MYALIWLYRDAGCGAGLLIISLYDDALCRNIEEGSCRFVRLRLGVFFDVGKFIYGDFWSFSKGLPSA